MKKGFVYILECADGSFYTGSTIDIEVRIKQHQDGSGANHTKKRLPVKMVYLEEYTSVSDAFYREKQIQGWSREKKLALIENKKDLLPSLSVCKNETHYKEWLRLRSATQNHRMKEEYYSNGKLLITGEYLVLDGAKSLAIPTKFGQDLTVQNIKGLSLIWESFDELGNCWFQAEYRLKDLRIVNETFDANSEDSKESIAQTLQTILLTAKKMNPEFLSGNSGTHIKTKLTFPRNWGLGTSSTLINNIAQWASVNAFELLKLSFGGSGYDIACAQNDVPIFYQRCNKQPIVEQVKFHPNFSDQLYFVYLNIKQDSKKGIQRYKEQRGTFSSEIEAVNAITEAMIECQDLSAFEKLMLEHEQLISGIIQNKPIQEILFKDYFGQVKSLGAWGGDFVLATGNQDTPNYFKEKGFEIVIPYRDMVL